MHPSQQSVAELTDFVPERHFCNPLERGNKKEGPKCKMPNQGPGFFGCHKLLMPLLCLCQVNVKDRNLFVV